MYYWVVDYSERKDGTKVPIVIKGRAFSSELQAQRYIDEANLSRNAEIFELSSSNEKAATQELKAKLIRRYKSLDKGMTRVSHRG